MVFVLVHPTKPTSGLVVLPKDEGKTSSERGREVSCVFRDVLKDQSPKSNR